MRRALTVVLSLAAMLAFANNAIAQAVPIDLGTLGGSSSNALAVNAKGQVVGDSSLTGDEGFHAFSWTEDRGMIDLGSLGGDSEAKAVNDRGQVVGISRLSNGTEIHAFSWTEAGGMVDLGTLGGNSSQAVAVNNRGQVVGQSTAADGSVHAFLWTEADGMMNLGGLGGTYTEVVAFNNKGQAVGYSYLAGNTAAHAFSWTEADGMVDLGTLGGTTSIAGAVNDRGQVVGSSGRADRSVHAFSWTRAEGMVDLGTLSGTNESLARAVNNKGQVVGESYLTDPEVARAFSLTGQPPAKGNDRRRRRLVNLGTIGGTFSSAAAVNEHGQIVGSSALTDTNDPDFAGVFHAFSWTEAGGIVDLGTLGDMNSFAIAINDKGQVVGSSYVPGGTLSRALLWNTKPR